jgi:pentatricopeptide repeat protein
MIEIYNSIIYAYGRAGNCQAAEFYFWEMRRKGLKQSSMTYNNLFFALSFSQSVGAQSYGSFGTYIPTPHHIKPTKDQEALMTAGPDMLHKLSMSLVPDWNYMYSL